MARIKQESAQTNLVDRKIKVDLSALLGVQVRGTTLGVGKSSRVGAVKVGAVKVGAVKIGASKGSATSQA